MSDVGDDRRLVTRQLRLRYRFELSGGYWCLVHGSSVVSGQLSLVSRQLVLSDLPDNLPLTKDKSAPRTYFTTTAGIF
jgi:hypothetical protein